jgi:bifunctional non-homologous end joining protein LigD
MNPAAFVEVAGVRITHPDRELFAASDRGPAVSKAALARYMADVAPRLLPHIAERPVSLLRCPQGHDGPCFFQKHWTTTPPPGVEPVEVREESGERAPYLIVRNVTGLVSLVQHGVIEVHPWGAVASAIDQPDRAIFDLDPAPDVAFTRVAATAERLRGLLRQCGLTSWLKSTGGKGLHVVVPLAPTAGWADLHDFVRLTTAQLLLGDPDGLVDTASKAARTGKIFVDYLRNGRGATAVAPWSPRARPGAPIAVPLSWRDLPSMAQADVAHVAHVAAWRAAHPRNPWAAMMRSRQTLTQQVFERLLTADPHSASAGKRRRHADGR